MRAAILAPGPSFAGFLKQPSSPDVCIGVNRAASAYPCDYWVAADRVAVDAFPAIGTPILFVPRVLPKKMTDEKRRIVSVFMYWEDLSPSSPIPLLGNVFSLIAAVVLAVHLKAKSLDLYGCDWEGTLDWDGSESIDENRCPDRWAKERGEFDVVARWLDRQRIPWTRHTETAP